jgi:hypothetical protein
MALSGVESMVPVRETPANIHVVTWKTPEAEADGMAKAIVDNILAHCHRRRWRCGVGQDDGRAEDLRRAATNSHLGNGPSLPTPPSVP